MTGPKRSSSSYASIAQLLKLFATEVLFISDVAEEVEAAVGAGMRGLIAVRPGNAGITPGRYHEVTTFDDVG